MKKIVYLFVAMMLGFMACTKVVDSTTTNTGTGTGTTTTGPAFIKFYNVMDYGDIVVNLAGTGVGVVPIYYPTAYKTTPAGSNNIKITFNGGTIVDINADLLGDKYYSCYLYRVGYNWRVSVVRDDLTTPATGKANVRVLDFRSQAYFDYVKVRFYSPAGEQLDYFNRNFLDHLSYDTYTTFKPLQAGNYKITVFNDSTTLATKTDYPLVAGKVYSMVMMTPASLTAAEAIYRINLDVQPIK